MGSLNDRHLHKKDTARRNPEAQYIQLYLKNHFFFRFKYWWNVTTLAIGIASTSLEYIWVSAICSQFGTELQLKQFHCEQYIINFRAYKIQDQKDILDVSSISTNWQSHTVVFVFLAIDIGLNLFCQVYQDWKKALNYGKGAGTFPHYFLLQTEICSRKQNLTKNYLSSSLYHQADCVHTSNLHVLPWKKWRCSNNIFKILPKLCILQKIGNTEVDSIRVYQSTKDWTFHWVVYSSHPTEVPEKNCCWW